MDVCFELEFLHDAIPFHQSGFPADMGSVIPRSCNLFFFFLDQEECCARRKISKGKEVIVVV